MWFGSELNAVTVHSKPAGSTILYKLPPPLSRNLWRDLAARSFTTYDIRSLSKSWTMSRISIVISVDICVRLACLSVLSPRV